MSGYSEGIGNPPMNCNVCGGRVPRVKCERHVVELGRIALRDKYLNLFVARYALIALVLLFTTAAHAGKVHSQSGVFATVADSSVQSFQCLINQLELQRYPIKFMRGCGKGSVRGSLHPACMALDINQTRRHVTVPRMPSNEIALANGCGLISGAQWHGNPDSGHFQLGGWSGKYAARVYRTARKIHTKAPKARGFFDWLFNR